MANPDRKMATIRRVASVDPIDGADRIERVTIDGWQVVTAKGAFQPGELCVYMEPDTFLDVSDPRYAFLAERGVKEMEVDGRVVTGHVLKVAKLRGTYSSGIAFKVPELLPQLPEERWAYLCDNRHDVSKMCGVREFVPVTSSGTMSFLGKYDTFVAPRTDCERCQNVKQHAFDLLKGTDYYANVKVDGTSATICLDPRDNVLKVYSHNNRLSLDDGMGRAMLECATEQGLVGWCEAHVGMTLQFEFAGEKIGGNRLGLKGRRCFVFSAYDIKAREYLDPYELLSGTKVERSLTPLLDLDLDQFDKPTDLLDYADSMVGNVTKGRHDEGVVIHVTGRGGIPEDEWPTARQELYDALGSTMQMKAVSPLYLSKQK